MCLKKVKIKEKYFSDYINSGVYQYHYQEVYEIICDLHLDPNGMVSFIVGKWNFKIKGESLFKKIERNNAMMNWFGIVHYSEFDQYHISQGLLIKRMFMIRQWMK